MQVFKKILLTIPIGIFLVVFSPSLVKADTITPAISTQSIVSGNTVKGNLTFKNESDQTVTISPEVSNYNPKTLEILTDDSSIFVNIDKDTYPVKPQETLTLSYIIKAPQNLSTGTYFNIIVLKKSDSSSYLNQQNTLGVNQILSQLVVLNIFDADNTYFKLGTDFAQISMTIEDPGIPFIKPMKVKYTYTNTTNYVLIPDGEIQVFDSKSSYSPIYQKINKNGDKLYPGDTKEETITINQWKISDILFGRKIIGHFYNGVDDNSQTKELSQSIYYVYLGIILAVVFLVILLVKSIQKDRKK